MGAKQEEGCSTEDPELEEGIVISRDLDSACRRTRDSLGTYAHKPN